MDYYVGMDVSLPAGAISFIDADGKRIFERLMACEFEDRAPSNIPDRWW